MLFIDTLIDASNQIQEEGGTIKDQLKSGSHYKWNY